MTLHCRSVVQYLAIAAVSTSSAPSRDKPMQRSTKTRAICVSVRSSDRSPERLPLLAVIHRPAQRRLAGGDGNDRKLQTFPGKLLHQIPEALVLLADQIVSGNTYIIEKEFRRVSRMQADLFEVAALAVTGALAFYQKQRDALRPLGWVSLGRDDGQIGMLAIADKGLLVVQTEAIAFAVRDRPHRLQIGPAAGSVLARAPTRSPRINARSQRAFCSGEPHFPRDSWLNSRTSYRCAVARPLLVRPLQQVLGTRPTKIGSAIYNDHFAVDIIGGVRN
jgi:hypothetical protein